MTPNGVHWHIGASYNIALKAVANNLTISIVLDTHPYEARIFYCFCENAPDGKGRLAFGARRRHGHHINTDSIVRDVDINLEAFRCCSIEVSICKRPATAQAEIRHKVAVRVGGLVRSIEGIEAHHNFPAITHVVTIGIPVARIRTDSKLFKIGETVTVEVGILGKHIRLKRRARIEASFNIGICNWRTYEDICRIKFFCLEIAWLREIVDVCLIPEVIFPAIREAVAVSILNGGIHARIAVRAWLGRPERKILIRFGIKIICLSKLLPSLGFVWRIRVSIDDIEISIRLRHIKRIETIAKTANLHSGSKLHANRSVAITLATINGGEEVLVWVRRGKIYKVILDNLISTSDEFNQIAATPSLHRKDIRNAVSVDIAEVIGSAPLARENCLNRNLRIIAILIHLGRQKDFAVCNLARNFRRNRIVDNHALGRAIIAIPMENPAIEIRILLEFVRIVLFNHLIGLRITSGANRLILLAVKLAIINIAYLITKRPNPCLDTVGIIPPQSKVFCSSKDSTARIRMPLAERSVVARSKKRILPRKSRCAKASRGSCSNGSQILRWRHVVVVRKRLAAAVLVEDRHCNGTRTRRAERRIEGIARARCTARHICFSVCRIIAAREAHANTRTHSCLSPRVRVILKDIVQNCPVNRELVGSTTHDNEAITLGVDGCHITDGSFVPHDELLNVLQVVFRPRKALFFLILRISIGIAGCGVEDLRPHLEAGREGKARTIHLHHINLLRFSTLEGQEIVFIFCAVCAISFLDLIKLVSDAPLKVANIRNALVALIKLEHSHILLGGRGRNDGKEHHHIFVRVVESAEIHPHLALGGRFAVKFDLVLNVFNVDNGLIDHRNIHRSACDPLTLVHILVVNLHLDFVLARLLECIGECTHRRIARDSGGLARRSRTRDSPARLKLIGQVIRARIVHESLEHLRTTNGIHTWEDKPLAFAFRLNVVHFDRNFRIEEERLHVQRPDALFGRAEARDDLCGIITHGATDHHFKSVLSTTRTSRTIQQGEIKRGHSRHRINPCSLGELTSNGVFTFIFIFTFIFSSVSHIRSDNASILPTRELVVRSRRL